MKVAQTVIAELVPKEKAAVARTLRRGVYFIPTS